MRKSNAGITLMELMVVMAIVGILTAIAIPSYRSYVIRANRTDAKTALLAAAGALERCFTRFNSYAAADGCAVVFPVASTDGHYVITAPTQTAVAFTVTATPILGQLNDTACGNFTLDNANTRGVSGATPVRRCWGR
ncbi:MAG TPA: type IV pilin protein [Steroidobacteraceae bacterium]|nr:type IV pilin protein [Steroidobacteraceae bacterium]